MEINKLTENTIPQRLTLISSPPKTLYSSMPAEQLAKLLKRKTVSIVGSRKVSTYGRRVTTELAGKLAEQGVVIISGLALGVDAIAHQAALDANGITIAVLPGPLHQIYPSSHRALAEQIVKHGGALLSEYSDPIFAFKANFIARNRLISGLGDALLITEAAENSGTLHTARFALEQGKDVLAVPGEIFSETSKGTNNLIRAGATPVTSVEDVLHVLGLQSHEPTRVVKGRNTAEQAVLELLLQGTNDGEALQRASQLEIAEFNQTLTMLEISGKIRSLGANQWALV